MKLHYFTHHFCIGVNEIDSFYLGCVIQGEHQKVGSQRLYELCLTIGVAYIIFHIKIRLF